MNLYVIKMHTQTNVLNAHTRKRAKCTNTGECAKCTHRQMSTCNTGEINMNILVAIVYYSFAKCYHWGKLDRRRGTPCIISHNCI